MQRRRWLDQNIATRVQFALRNQVVADNSVPLIAQHRFKKADLQRLTEVKDTEAILGHAAARITETASHSPVVERVRVSGEVDAAESLTWPDRREMEHRICEGRRRIEPRHLCKSPRHALRRFHDFARAPLS
jgi:hypothetical protein